MLGVLTTISHFLHLFLSSILHNNPKSGMVTKPGCLDDVESLPVVSIILRDKMTVCNYALS